jgi:hypothetical protein
MSQIQKDKYCKFSLIAKAKSINNKNKNNSINLNGGLQRGEQRSKEDG